MRLSSAEQARSPEPTLAGGKAAAQASALFPGDRNHRALRAERQPGPPKPTMAITPSGRLGSWHLPFGETLSSFCEKLNSQGLSYVVLPMPAADCKGAALLVSDNDILSLRNRITRTPFGEQVAIYSTTGVPGFSFQQHWRFHTDATNMAVLPPYLAESVLDRAETDASGRKVPSTEDRLLWVLYRTLYLSGDANTLRGSSGRKLLLGPITNVIASLAAEAGADLVEPFELDALDRYLSARGWEPPYEVLRRLSCWNSWAASKLSDGDPGGSFEEAGVTAFFVRREVLESDMLEAIGLTVESCGFELLKTVVLDSAQTEVATRLARGANWGPGSLPVNGGRPVQMMIALDVLPARVSDGEQERYPFLDNQRTLHAKLKCRELIKERLPRQRWFNPLHATDDSGEAWKFIRMFAPQEEGALRALIESRRAEFATSHEVVRNLSRRANRAKVEVISYGDGLAVRKTFRRNCIKYMDRELAVLDILSPLRPEILPVLERGPNYFITPFVEGRPLRRRVLGKAFPKLMTLQQVRDSADLLHCFFAHGFDPVDFGPHNLLVAKSGKLTALDFELAVRGGEAIKPELSACLHGVGDRFEHERPVSSQLIKLDPYGERWFPYTGLTLASFLRDPRWLQVLKRLVNHPAYLVRKALQQLSSALRALANTALKRWVPVLSRIANNAYRSGGRWR